MVMRNSTPPLKDLSVEQLENLLASIPEVRVWTQEKKDFWSMVYSEELALRK